MGEEYKKAILKIWEMHQLIKPEFSCTLFDILPRLKCVGFLGANVVA